MILVAALACAQPSVVDAGSPDLLDGFDPAGGALYSELRDAGWSHVPGRYNVLLASAEAAEGVAREVKDGWPGLQLRRRYTSFPGMSIEATYAEAQLLASFPGVLSVEPDALLSATDSSTSGCASTSTESRPIGISALGRSMYTGAEVRVAVLDSGIDLTHPDLSVVGGASFIEGSDGYNDDHYHGTHVAGTVAALDNTQGVVGVAPAVSLYAVKVLDSGGSGAYSEVAGGIDWATTEGMQVANMSLGGSSDDATMHAAITAARAAGVIVVVAAGNDADDSASFFPAAYDGEVLTVSAYDLGARAFADFTNYGDAVDIAAPGVAICSTYVGSTYGELDGTSMASPHVAGAVALYLQHRPGSTFSQVEAAIERGARALADTAEHTENLLSISRL